MESPNMVERLARFSLTRRVTMVMILMTLVAVGLISTFRLPLEMNPRGLEGHYIQVNVRWNVGVPPETLDKIGLPLEEELSTVAGLESITTHGYKWGSRIELRFKPGTDMDVAYREVRDRTERARTRFPEGTEKPYIYKHQPGAEPVVSFRISYDPDSDYYDLISKYVITPIQRIMGVADVNFRIYQREIRIEVDKDRAEAHGINIQQLGSLLRADNLTLAGGQVEEGGKKYSLKSSSQFHHLDEIRNLPIKDNILLKDIATVVYEPEEAERLYRYNSQPANGISVNREGEANTVEVSREVVKTIEEIQKNPILKGFDLSIYENQGEEIIQRLRQLIESGLQGAVLAAFVLLFFLRQVRMTLVIALTIPVCLLIALTTLYFTGQTLNGLTIMGLVICVGLLVDNSVVVAENIYRHRHQGLSRNEACLRGVSEIGFAITIATLTTLIVFCSAMLVDGKLKFVIQHMSVPFVSAILASLGAALMLVPLGVYATLSEKASASPVAVAPLSSGLKNLFSRIEQGIFGKLNRGYQVALVFFLRRRLDLCLILGVLLSLTYFMAGKLNYNAEKEELIRYFRIFVDFPEKYTMEQRLAYFRKVEALVERKKEVYGLKAHEVHYGKWYGLFAGFFALDRKAELSRQEAIDLLFEDFPQEAGVRIRHQGKEGDEGSDGKQNMHYIRLVGDDPELLNQVAEDLKPVFEKIPGVVSFLEKNSDEGPSELALIVDREKANSLGVNPNTLAGTIGAGVRGENLPRLVNKGRQIPMKLLFEEEDRSQVADLSNFQVPTEDGRSSTVGAMTQMTFLKNDDDAISRHNKKVRQWFGMRLKSGPGSSAIKKEIEEVKSRINLPEGVSFDETNLDLDEEDREKGMTMIWLSIAFVYMLMAFFFESLLIPLAIILTIPLASMGAIFVLKVSNIYIDDMVYTGGLLLVGIVVNNGIVLVDYSNRIRQQGMSRDTAFLTAVQFRFRPIMMTAMTTICGMIPLTFGGGQEGGLYVKSFGLVLMGGMASATLFTLLAVPVFYTLIEDARTAMTNVIATAFGRASRGK